MSCRQASGWTICPMCGREYAVTADGRFMWHRITSGGTECPGSDRTLLEIWELVEQDLS